ncbi:hypothetical protein TNCV_4474341 [Trichonephila clavipes]|nr:hypothetical protein TNCV_4474341 [Trichonephila clavipes]
MANSDGAETSSVLFNSRILFAKECMVQICLSFGFEWKSSDPKGDKDDYFFEELLEAVLRTIHNAQDLIIDQYNGWFKTSDRTLNLNNFKQFLDFITYLSCNSPYSHEKLIDFLAFVTRIAVKAYSDGVTEAPNYAVVCITYALTAFKFDSYSSNNLMKFSGDCKKGLFY